MSTLSLTVASPSPTVTPVATATPVAVTTVVQAPATVNASLLSQVQHVDPLVWTVLLGSLVVPVIQQLVKRFVKQLHDKRHRTTNYAIAGGLSLLVGVLTDLQNSGALTRLHNPLLATILSASLSFLLGQQVYGFFIKTNEDANKLDTLPTVTNP